MDEAEARAERLKALKQAKQLLDEGRDEGQEPRLRFRNYELRDATIQHVKLPQAQPPSATESAAEVARPPDFAPESVTDIAPKKLNFDLKRDVEGKLQLLEKRTHRALIQLQQEEERKRLEQEGGVADADHSPSHHSSDSDAP